MPKPGAPPSFDPPSAVLANFTDREPQREIFARLLEAPTGTSLPVVMFYGVGGIGKSWLQKLLHRDYVVPQRLPAAQIDFNVERVRSDSAMAMAMIRQQFAVECPRFDLAYSMLRYKQVAGSEPTLKGSPDAAMAWDIVLSFALAPIPGGSILTKLIERVGKAAAPHFKKSALHAWLADKNGQGDLPLLFSQTDQEIVEGLARRLRDDLARALPTRTGKACRGVVFLDTFESLALNVAGDSQQEMKERWVRTLCATLDQANVLFVIAGQNQLTWGEVDSGWNDRDCLEQHLVGGLSSVDARRFLTKCSINDNALQDAILRFSREHDGSHHTWSLGLCADVCVAERASGIQTDPSTLRLKSGDLTALADRFLKSLRSRELEAWIVALALTPRFDETAARALHGGSLISQMVAWNALLGYSFVAPSDNEGWYTIRLQMRDALLRVASEGEVTSWHEFWRTHWRDRALTPTDAYSALSWFHHWNLDPEEALTSWNSLAEGARTDGNVDMLLHYTLLGWWDAVDFDQELSANSAYLKALIARGVEQNEATLGDRNDNLRTAITFYEAALRFYTEQAFPQQWAMTQNNLANAYTNLPSGDRDANLRAAIACYEAALRVRTEQAFPQQWAMTQSNLGIAYEAMGDLKAAVEAWTNSVRGYRAVGLGEEADSVQNWISEAGYQPADT